MKRLILVVTLIAVVLITGCGRRESTEEQAGEKELLLYCGAGIRPPAAELAETFEREHGVKIITNYAGSETLLSTIRLARSGDLYLPGDKHYIEQALQEGMILSRQSVSYWIPTILVQKGNPKNIQGLRDLLQPGLKLGLGDPDACAIGRISYEIFARNNIDTEDIEKNLAFPSLTVNELGMQIQAKSLDAVIVWNAIAQYYSEHGDEVSIAPEKNVVSTIDIGVLKFTKHRELAEKFVDFFSSEQGQNVFKKHNYSTEAPE
ncbi:MAG: molybdate ABC transporter substrate-binding protein [Planctomycetota bacterium]|jgi:molybdate transport system substrate-binding protein